MKYLETHKTEDKIGKGEVLKLKAK